MKDKVLHSIAVVMLLASTTDARRLNRHSNRNNMFLDITDNGIIGTDDIATSSNDDMFAFS